MKYLSVADIAKKWQVSERTVRNYCANNRIDDAFQTGKTWNIPKDAEKPQRLSKASKGPKNLLEALDRERKSNLSGGIYHRVQIDLTYNSNHIEGSKLSHEQTRFIFETNTIGITDKTVNVDDIVETANHFKCIDIIIQDAKSKLSERLIKRLHKTLKSGTSDSRKDWFAVGDYKRFPNEVVGMETTEPEYVAAKIKALLQEYNKTEVKTLADIIAFHVQFEKIHPFQDGNGRVGKLLMFKECLRNNIVPFIIGEDLKLFYYRGLKEWKQEQGFLLGTCEEAQDRFRQVLDYFRVPY